MVIDLHLLSSDYFIHRYPLECLAQIGQASTPQSTSGDSTFSQIIHSKTVHSLALFLLMYVGVEVTIGGDILPCMRIILASILHI